MTRLIKALRETADNISLNIKDFEWGDPANCNCGMLAQTICKMDASGISLSLKESNLYSSWEYMANRQQQTVCSTTGLSMNFVFRKLKNAGMKWKDFSELETLSNPDILKRARISPEKHINKDPDYSPGAYYVKPQLTIRYYMRAWADMLEEKQLKRLADRNRSAIKLARSVEKTIEQINIPTLQQLRSPGGLIAIKPTKKSKMVTNASTH